MDHFKYLHHVPRIPLQLSKYDLTGVKVNPKDYTVVSNNPPPIYYPNINGMISFIIYHTLYSNPARNLSRPCHNVSECDLKNGHLFIVTIPFNMFKHFTAEYEKNHANGPPCFIEISIDDIFKFPIYSMHSFGKLSKYQRDLSFLSEPFPQLQHANIDILPYIRKRNILFCDVKYILGAKINYSKHNGMRHIMLTESSLYSHTKYMKEKMKENTTLWNGSMHTLEPWTYSNSKEQLKLIWNSRALELIDF